MSSFLQRLKGGTSTVDNKAPPDNAGVVIRKLEKKVVSQPVEQLGITFGNDAEVTSVAPRSPAAVANIPVGYMVFDVNGEFIENEDQFAEAACKNLNLVIKLQSTAGISELIARVLRDEEMRMNGEISESSINFDELLRTTPRFNFLSGDHPLFFRYSKRLKHASQAAALIAQRTREAELQRQKDIKERMRKALEEEQAAQKRKEEQEAAERARLNASTQSGAFLNSEPFLKIIRDESEFGQTPIDTRKIEVSASVASPVPQAEPSASLAPESPLEPAVQPLSIEPQEAVAPVSAEELLALVGLPTDEAPAAVPSPPITTAVTPVPQSEDTVSYIALPAEEYTLCSGEKVVSVIKRRTGRIPPPPPGKPPGPNTAMLSTAPTSFVKVEGARDTSARKSYTSSRHYTERKRSRSPASRHRSERRHSSRDDSHYHDHRSSSSRRDHRSSRDSKYRR